MTHPLTQMRDALKYIVKCEVQNSDHYCGKLQAFTATNMLESLHDSGLNLDAIPELIEAIENAIQVNKTDMEQWYADHPDAVERAEVTRVKLALAKVKGAK